MKNIIIASKNPVKINTTKIGFEKIFLDEKFNFEGVSTESGVPDQPMSEEETFQGALNRVNNASKIKPEADFWTGIEGGLKKVKEELEAFAWIIIKNKEGKIGKGRTGSFILPRKVSELIINEGKELGEADDIVFNKSNSKQSNGAVGILTNDVLTRTTFYEPAVVLALIPFKNPGLY
jgi:inosine/xanthosine triphosphatase